VLCPRCGHEAPLGGYYCTLCRAPLHLACRACGTVNAPGSRLCGESATALLDEEAPDTLVRREEGLSARRWLMTLGGVCWGGRGCAFL
jgi:hypothetical protein